jgi:hypothetical protein
VLEGLLRQAGEQTRAAEVTVLLEVLQRTEAASEEARSEGTVGNDACAKLLAGREEAIGLCKRRDAGMLLQLLDPPVLLQYDRNETSDIPRSKSQTG